MNHDCDCVMYLLSCRRGAAAAPRPLTRRCFRQAPATITWQPQSAASVLRRFKQHGGRLQPVAVGHPQNGDVYGSDGPLTLSQTALMCPPQDMRLVMPTATVAATPAFQLLGRSSTGLLPSLAPPQPCQRRARSTKRNVLL